MPPIGSPLIRLRCVFTQCNFWRRSAAYPQLLNKYSDTIASRISLPSTNQSDTTRFTMAILSTLLVGLIVGAIAKLLMPGKDPGGFIITILLGIAGAFIATYIGQAIGWYKAGQPAGWIMSVIGAMILLLLYRLIFKPKT